VGISAWDKSIPTAELYYRRRGGAWIEPFYRIPQAATCVVLEQAMVPLSLITGRSLIVRVLRDLTNSIDRGSDALDSAYGWTLHEDLPESVDLLTPNQVSKRICRRPLMVEIIIRNLRPPVLVDFSGWPVTAVCK